MINILNPLSSRLTSCSLVLLGHIFLSLGNGKESMNMVTPAMQLASKIPDVHVQLWASSILKVGVEVVRRIRDIRLIFIFARTCTGCRGTWPRSRKGRTCTPPTARLCWTITSRPLRWRNINWSSGQTAPSLISEFLNSFSCYSNKHRNSIWKFRYFQHDIL